MTQVATVDFVWLIALDDDGDRKVDGQARF